MVPHGSGSEGQGELSTSIQVELMAEVPMEGELVPLGWVLPVFFSSQRNDGREEGRGFFPTYRLQFRDKENVETKRKDAQKKR